MSTHLLGRKHLQIPVGRGIGVLKNLLREKIKTGTLEAGRHDDHVALDFLLAPRPAFGHAFRAAVEPNAVFGDADNIATQPFGVALADLVEDIRVDHRRPSKQPFLRRRQIFQIAIEKDAKQALRDPREDRFFAEHVEREEYVDDGVAGDDPLVGPRQHDRFGGVGVDDEFERFDGRGAAADDQDLFTLARLAVEVGGVVDLALEDFLVGNVRHFRLAASSDGGQDTIVAAVGGVVDNPAVLLVFVDGGDSSVELGAVFEAVVLPELSDLGDDLLAVWVAGAPLQGRKEAVHDAVDLETAGVVDSLQGRFSI